MTIESDEGTFTLKNLRLKFAQVCDPSSGHASGEMVLAGTAQYKRRRKAGA